MLRRHSTSPTRLTLSLCRSLAGTCTVDIDQVVDTRLLVAVAHTGLRVSHGTFELADDRIRVVHQINTAVRVLIGLGHLLFRFLQAHNLRAHLADI